MTVVFFAAVFFDFRKTMASLEGWGTGAWNDTVGYIKDMLGNYTEQFSGEPTTGWLSSNSQLSGCGGALSQKYSIIISGGDSERTVGGSAWFGIGSDSDSTGDCQSDLPSLGWLKFDVGYPSFCSSMGLVCNKSMWHKKDGGSGLEGTINGWAQITSMMQMPRPDGTFSDNGWVELKDINVDSSGMISGWGWNSGEETLDYRDPALGGNSGLGWIKMDGLKIVECDIGCSPKQLCRGSTFSSCDASFCAGSGTSCALQEDKVSWNCSSDCGEISCSPQMIDPEIGVCGPLNGKSLCDLGREPTDEELCANNMSPHNFSRGVPTATWECGNSCPGGSVVSCSARTRCGWIETNP